MIALYWSSTGLIAAFLLLSAGSYLFSAATIEGLRALGFPDFFRWQLLVLKLLAVPVLLLPSLPMPLRDWAYAGVALFLLTALVAHIAHQDPWTHSLMLIVLGVALALSRWSLMQMRLQ